MVFQNYQKFNRNDFKHNLYCCIFWRLEMSAWNPFQHSVKGDSNTNLRHFPGQNQGGADCSSYPYSSDGPDMYPETTRTRCTVYCPKCFCWNILNMRIIIYVKVCKRKIVDVNSPKSPFYWIMIKKSYIICQISAQINKCYEAMYESKQNSSSVR